MIVHIAGHPGDQEHDQRCSRCLRVLRLRNYRSAFYRRGLRVGEILDRGELRLIPDPVEHGLPCTSADAHLRFRVPFPSPEPPSWLDQSTTGRVVEALPGAE